MLHSASETRHTQRVGRLGVKPRCHTPRSSRKSRASPEVPGVSPEVPGFPGSTRSSLTGLSVWVKDRTRRVSARGCCGPPAGSHCGPRTVHRRKFRGPGKAEILAPESSAARQGNGFNVGLRDLPTQKNAPDSSTHDVWFALINSNLSMFPLCGFCCKTSYMSWLLLSLWNSPSDPC